LKDVQYFLGNLSIISRKKLREGPICRNVARPDQSINQPPRKAPELKVENSLPTWHLGSAKRPTNKSPTKGKTRNAPELTIEKLSTYMAS
jgi:hypothetical protein